MIIGGLVAVFLAVDADGKPPEDVARPLSVVAKPAETISRAGATAQRRTSRRPPGDRRGLA
jgi:hypothetical protein